MRAQLSQILDGVPVPEDLHRIKAPLHGAGRQPRGEYVIALYITAGRVSGDPRYGDPATRLADTAAQWHGAAADDAVQSGLHWIDSTERRQAKATAGGGPPSRKTPTGRSD
jgi:hypothetical protein